MFVPNKSKDRHDSAPDKRSNYGLAQNTKQNNCLPHFVFIVKRLIILMPGHPKTTSGIFKPVCVAISVENFSLAMK